MLDKFMNFLKNTFTYEEESEAETPPVVQSAPVEIRQAEESQPRERRERPARQRQSTRSPGDFVPKTVADPEEYFSPVASMTSRRKEQTPQPKYATDPIAAAKQQTDNFSALRPRPEDNQFRMLIEKVDYAKGAGVLVFGNIGVGIAHVDCNALIVHAANRTTVKTKVIAIGRDGKKVSAAPAGSTVGLLLNSNITRNDVHAGDVIGSINV